MMFEDELNQINSLEKFCLDNDYFNNNTLINSLETYYHVRFTYTSNYIEGFTYDEDETYDLIFNNKVADFKSPLETGAVRGHDLSFKYMMELQDENYLEEEDILKFHELLAGGLENNAVAGRYRSNRVHIGGKEFISPDKVRGAMKKMIKTLEEARDNNFDPIMLALRYHKDIVFIHPFADGNGRVARLAMNTILLQNKYLPIDIHPDYRQDYHRSIAETYTNSNAFFKFMLEQAIMSYTFIINKLNFS
jgi:Fic family protein